MPVQNSPRTQPGGRTRYKTLPAHPKYPFSTHFAPAGRVLYRFHHHQAEQGEKSHAPTPHLTHQRAPPPISHAIHLNELSTKPRNVAIPTITIQISKYSQGNCMRNWRGRIRGWRRVRAAAHEPPDWSPPRGLRACGAWPGSETTHRTRHQRHKPHWCGGRRRVRRARAGFEIDHSERSSRVAISRAAGPDGAQNTRGATSNNARRGRLAGGPPPTGTPSSPAQQSTRGARNTSDTTSNAGNQAGRSNAENQVE